jgi:hypothetical protein
MSAGTALLTADQVDRTEFHYPVNVFFPPARIRDIPHPSDFSFTTAIAREKATHLNTLNRSIVLCTGEQITPLFR